MAAAAYLSFKSRVDKIHIQLLILRTVLSIKVCAILYIVYIQAICSRRRIGINALFLILKRTCLSD